MVICTNLVRPAVFGPRASPRGGGGGSVGSQRKSDVLGERLLTRRWSLALHNLPLQDLTNDYRVRIRGVGKTGRANEYDSQ